MLRKYTCFVALLTTAFFARADVVYRVTLVGSPPGPETPLPTPTNGVHVIADAALTGFTDGAIVHIYDTTGTVDESTLYPIEIRGSSPNGQALRVSVSNESVGGDAFLQLPRDDVAPGLRNFAGIRVVGPTGPTGPSDPSTTAHDTSTVSISIVGDVTGHIEVGQVYHLNAQRFFDGTGGNVVGDITIARTYWGFTGWGGRDIRFLRAANSITGDITVEGDLNLDPLDPDDITALAQGGIDSIRRVAQLARRLSFVPQALPLL